jgi:EpsI family protein
MRKTLSILAPVFLAVQALLAHWGATVEHPPSPPDLAQFPAAFGQWKQFREDPVEPEIQGLLGAGQLLSRSYVQKQTGDPASLFVAWFQSQTGGATQPHSPKACLPGSGWIPEVADQITLEAEPVAIRVNRYIVANRGQRAVVLYWFQTPRRAIANEWAAKFWLVSDALRDRRTDTSLIRIVVMAAPGKEDAATATAIEFGRSLYPQLKAQLPQIDPMLTAGNRSEL